MALKDWDKAESPIEGNSLYINSKDNSYRIVLYREYPSHKYEFIVRKWDGGKWMRVFKNKRMALAFAKAYMRRH